VFCLVLSGGTPRVALGAGPQGFYLLQSVDRQSIPDRALASPAISGLSIRVTWASLEPREGSYDWTFLDGQIARAARAGKHAQIRIMTGTSAPNWLYVAGAQGLRFSDDRKGSTTYTMPLPWDPILHAKWAKFCSALGAKYSSDSTVTLVHISGTTRFSAEMHLPAEIVGHPAYSPQKIVDGWKASIVALRSALPATQLSLNASKAAIARDGVTEQVIAECQKLLNSKAVFQHNALAAKTSPHNPIHALVAQQKKLGYTIGFQMLSGSSQPRFGGTLKQALDIGMAAGASYFEIYLEDLRDNESLLKQYAASLPAAPQATPISRTRSSRKR